MSLQIRLGLAAVMLGLAAGCSNPADDAAKAKVSDAEPVSETAAVPGTESAAEMLAISPKTTTIEFVGSKVTGSHEGGFKAFEGTFALAAPDILQSRLDVEIDMDSTWSDSEKLTGHLKSADFFHVEEHPTAKFVSTAFAAAKDAGKEDSGEDSKEQSPTHHVTGNLMLHGVSKSISFPATLDISDETVSLTSEFSINRRDFDIVYDGQPDNLIRDDVLIRIAIEAPRGGSGAAPEASGGGEEAT